MTYTWSMCTLAPDIYRKQRVLCSWCHASLGRGPQTYREKVRNKRAVVFLPDWWCCTFGINNYNRKFVMLVYDRLREDPWNAICRFWPGWIGCTPRISSPSTPWQTCFSLQVGQPQRKAEKPTFEITLFDVYILIHASIPSCYQQNPTESIIWSCLKPRLWNCALQFGDSVLQNQTHLLAPVGWMKSLDSAQRQHEIRHDTGMQYNNCGQHETWFKNIQNNIRLKTI